MNVKSVAANLFQAGTVFKNLFSVVPKSLCRITSGIFCHVNLGLKINFLLALFTFLIFACVPVG